MCVFIHFIPSGFPRGSVVKMQFRSLGQEDPLEEEMATYSSIAWRIPWTEELQRRATVHRVAELDVTEHARLQVIP